MISPPCLLEFDFEPYRLSGIVYGTLLNHEPAIAALDVAARQPPYKAVAKAPVLYIKPRNTLIGHGDTVTVPVAVPELEVGASLGIVIGKTACHVTEDQALEYVAGYIIVSDISVPHDMFYRPSIRLKARDGFCPIGPGVVPRQEISNPDDLKVRVYIDGILVHSTATNERRRTVARLLSDVTEFMTLAPGDILMLGVSAGAPRVRPGQHVRIEIDDVGQLDNQFVLEGALS